MTDSPASDIDSLDLMEASEGWALVKARIEKEIERKRSDLEHGIGEVVEIRGSLSALRMILALPAYLRIELKAEVKEQDV